MTLRQKYRAPLASYAVLVFAQNEQMKVLGISTTRTQNFLHSDRLEALTLKFGYSLNEATSMGLVLVTASTSLIL